MIPLLYYLSLVMEKLRSNARIEPTLLVLHTAATIILVNDKKSQNRWEIK